MRTEGEMPTKVGRKKGGAYYSLGGGKGKRIVHLSQKKEEGEIFSFLRKKRKPEKPRSNLG